MYRIEPDPSVKAQVDALPHDALLGYAEVLGVMELAPWSGEPINKRNPEGEVRQLFFGPHGAGMVTYLILERDREVHVLDMLWAD